MFGVTIKKKIKKIWQKLLNKQGDSVKESEVYFIVC